MEIATIFLISLFTLVSRIINLTKIPIFTDEAIYIRWAQVGLADPAQRFISLTDGKQPLLTWFMYPFLKIFSDPLFAGRFVSVISGVLAVIGIYKVSRELFDRRTAVFAEIIYIISPFTYVYDKLALMDSLLAALGIWSLYLSIKLIKEISFKNALLLGLISGLGLLTKSNALFFIISLPFSLLLYKPVQKKSLNFIKWVIFGGLSFVIAEFIYNLLRISPWFYIIKLKNYSFILTLGEFLKSPFALFIDNLHGLVPILVGYLTIPVFVTFIFGVIFGVLKKDRRIIYLLLWFLFPFLSLAAFGKVIFPRFILFMVYPIFIICSYVLDLVFETSKRVNPILFLLIPVVLFSAFYQSFILSINPIYADIPISDRNQLFDAWPSGFGVREVVSFINDKAKNGKVVLGTEGTFGLNPAVYEIYLKNNPNVDIRGYWPVSEVPKGLIESARNYPTYLVFKERDKEPVGWPLKLISKYRRGKGESYLLFYQVEYRDK